MTELGVVSDGAITATDAWRWAAASVAGSSHLRAGRGCDDANIARPVTRATGSPALVLAVSDGAGSARCSREGAAAAVLAFAEAVEGMLQVKTLEDLPSVASELLEAVRYQVVLRAMDLGVESRDCACTLLGAVLAQNKSFFLQVGDGAIVTRADEPGGMWQPVFWPQQGEYANTTYFVTQPEAHSLALAQFEDAPLAAIVLFTDGIQALCLDYASRTAHGPFFDYILEPVRHGLGRGHLEKSSQWLTDFLSSRQVNDRTDDDKTILVASKRCRDAAW